MDDPKFLPTLNGGWVNAAHIVQVEPVGSSSSYCVFMTGGLNCEVAKKVWIDYLGGWRHE
ncbi:MAG: hypothetical protein WA161_14140 [Pseudomonas sp.]|uniref:hypothetical protein n=1 Tax=Pseudomonas sp. TaxID=306 RepID=UPI003BB7CA6B